jgi:Co/Zn/Cd efflux system component
MKEESPKAIFYALAANLGIAICKFAAATFTGSGSMFAEAIHSTADCGNQLLLFQTASSLRQYEAAQLGQPRREGSGEGFAVINRSPTLKHLM